jgi:cytochrome c oxidase accessory protein FixG
MSQSSSEDKARQARKKPKRGGQKVGEAIEVVNVETPQMYSLYTKREKIYTRAIKGVYQRLRLYTGWPLLLGYFLLPWINIDGQQALFFDLPSRKFHILWLTFWPQDFVLLAWCLIIAAFALFFFTTWLGRVWCGYTCPQTVWTAIFMWAEQLTEGTRNQRIKLDKSPWTMRKIWRKTAKHVLWFGFALITGLTFIGYFYGMRDMMFDIYSGTLSLMGFAWILFFTLATYINAGWMREQVCMHMCPYARFQSAMFDRNTLIVSYDEKRGESRGRRRRADDHKAMGLGDCIDCNMCVQVCPTGIDIRDGMQYECIDCALCIDACDDVMDKMGYEKGLISYTTLAKLDGEKPKLLRPKLVGYGLALVIMVVAFSAKVFTRDTLQLDVLRDRSTLYVPLADGRIQNNYTLKIVNMDKNAHQLQLTVDGFDGLVILDSKPVYVEAGEVLSFPVAVVADKDKLATMVNDIQFSLVSDEVHEHYAVKESRFFGPSP